MSWGGGSEGPAFCRWDDAKQGGWGVGHGKIMSVLGTCSSPVSKLAV